MAQRVPTPCRYCGKHYPSRADAKNHESGCKSNPKNTQEAR